MSLKRPVSPAKNQIGTSFLQLESAFEIVGQDISTTLEQHPNLQIYL